MSIENSHKHENCKESEATLDVCDILDKGEKWGLGSQISEIRIGNLQIVEEEQNTHSRQILASNSETMGHGVSS